MEVIVLSPAQLEALVTRAIATALAATSASAPMKTEANLLTVKETAKRLRKSEKTVRDYIRLGVLPAVNANKGTALRASYSVLESDVNAYVKRLRG